MLGVKKPQREPGYDCPLYRKDVSEVCHTCEFYEGLPVRVGLQPDIKWGCVFTHTTFILRDVVTEINALQGKQAEFNDKVWKDSQANIQSLIEIARATEQQHGRSLAALVTIAQNIDRVGPPDDTKLIEGKS